MISLYLIKLTSELQEIETACVALKFAMPFALNKLFSFGVNYYEKAIDSWVECGVSSRSLKFVQVSLTNLLIKELTNTIILF